MSGQKSPQKTETKQKILTTARQLFLERDYDAVTMDDIAMMTGVSKGTVFYHFRSKEVLAVEVIETSFNDLLKKVTQDLESHSSPRERFLLFVRELVRAARDYQGLTKFLLQVLNRADDHVKKRVFQRSCMPYVTTCEQMLQDLGLTNTYLKSLILISLFDGLGLVFFLEGQNLSSDHDVEDLTSEIVKLFDCLASK